MKHPPNGTAALIRRRTPWAGWNSTRIRNWIFTYMADRNMRGGGVRATPLSGDRDTGHSGNSDFASDSSDDQHDDIDYGIGIWKSGCE